MQSQITFRWQQFKTYQLLCLVLTMVLSYQTIIEGEWVLYAFSARSAFKVTNLLIQEQNFTVILDTIGWANPLLSRKAKRLSQILFLTVIIAEKDGVMPFQLNISGICICKGLRGSTY